MMAWNKDHKQKSRERILDAAALRFTQQGYEAVAIDALMSDAGLTRGVFYSHFKSKSELYQQAMHHAARNMFRLLLTNPVDEHSALDPGRLISGYLSDMHVTSNEMGCPLAFLVTDVAQQSTAIRDTYTEIFQGMATHLNAATQQQRKNTLQQMVMMIGGVAIARAVSDPALQQEVLDAVRQNIKASVTTQSQYPE